MLTKKSLLVLFFVTSYSMAKPLGVIPEIEQGETRLEIEMLSDLWTSPYHRKDTPQRIAQIALKVPVLKTDSMRMSFAIEGENRSHGIPDLTIGDNQVRVGPQLKNETIGFGFGKVNDDKSSYSIFWARESASDETFQHRRDIWNAYSAVFKTAPNQGWNWLYGFQHSGNRGIWNGKTIPLFGFAYQYQPKLTITLGFPFLRIDWHDDDIHSAAITLTSVGLLGRFQIEVDSDLTIQVRGGLTNRAYSHVNRLEDDRRLYFEEKVIDVGSMLKLNEYTSYGFHLGYAADRKIFEATTVFSPIGPVRTVRSDIFGGFEMEYIF